jgi:hypothetical protein
MAVDSSDEEIEDDFNVTLRTPQRQTGGTPDPWTPALSVSPVSDPAGHTTARRHQAFTLHVTSNAVSPASNPGDGMSTVTKNPTPSIYINHTPAVQSPDPTTSVPRPSPRHHDTSSAPLRAAVVDRGIGENPTADVTPEGGSVAESFVPAPPPRASTSALKRPVPESFDTVPRQRDAKRRTLETVKPDAPVISRLRSASVKPGYVRVDRTARSNVPAHHVPRASGSTTTRRQPPQHTAAAPRRDQKTAAAIPRSGDRETEPPKPTGPSVRASRLRSSREQTGKSDLALPPAARAATDRAGSTTRAGMRDAKAPPSRTGSARTKVVGGQDRAGGAFLGS